MWNTWRAEAVSKENFKANLSGAYLYGANLIRANLRKADLRKADLYGANLIGALYSKHTSFPRGFRRENLTGPVGFVTGD